MKELYDRVETLREAMVNLQKELTARPAIAPENGGKGEKEKGLFLTTVVQEMGFEYERYDCFDERISDIRPNLRVIYPGKIKKNLWIITHLDVVPAGNLSLWETDPFCAVVKEDRIYGRGTEDNQQELVASLFALKALRDLNQEPRYTLSLLFVADEETGSRYGINYLLNNFSLFQEDDLIVVADAGNKEGSMIEIAEKSLLWLKFIIRGKQSHASSPEEGLNAHRLGAKFLCLLDKKLPKRFKKKNRLFEPPYSTFEPTKKEANVPNINTIPGEDVFYFDCRILPEYSPEEIESFIQELKEEFTKKVGGEISFSAIYSSEPAPPTNPKAEIIKKLKRAIKEVYGVKPFVKGIGGGTVAAAFRKKGLPVGVWGKYEGKAHQPNEYSLIDNMVNDAKVYCRLALL